MRHVARLSRLQWYGARPALGIEHGTHVAQRLRQRYAVSQATCAILAALALLAAISVVVAWQVYAYHDCRRVGHATCYCVGRLLR